MKYFILLIPSLSFAFSLSNTVWFDNPKIKVEIAGTTCASAGISDSKFQNLIQRAAKEFWNKVPTSAIYLDVGPTGAKDIDGMQMDGIINITENGQILAGCNDDIDGFDGSSEPTGVSGTLGVGSLTCSGSVCRGAFVLNVHATSQVSLLRDNDIVAVIAHEIGHSIGLGHSEYKHNLMYYSIGGKTQTWLGEDDIDGVNYLYPHDPEWGGILGSCATISTDIDNDFNFPGGHFFLSLIMGIFISMLLKKIISNRRLSYGQSSVPPSNI